MSHAPADTLDGRRRAIVENLAPQVDCGTHPIKRVVGERVVVEADVFCDGHDAVAAEVRYRRAGEEAWRKAPMEHIDNDRWRGAFEVDALGRFEYTVAAWVDHFLTWQRELTKRMAARQDLSEPFEIGARLLETAAGRAAGADADTLAGAATLLRAAPQAAARAETALSPVLQALAAASRDPRFDTVHLPVLEVVVDPVRARFGAWYELFPRSAGPAGRHGTFADVEARLPDIAALGFDVLYLPPIHPIGHTRRKGRNNALTAVPGDPGSPWAIGSEAGGHKDIHPELGTADDFRRLVDRARAHGIDIALDIAFQCSPDHPYVRTHPQWFRHRPDGSVQFAENPPKKYEDIYPFDFETADWQTLWRELESVFRHWIAQGVHIFRVDNPHTKSLRFWAWLIPALKAQHPELIFLSEAFTRPKLKYHLAKVGFTQSYNYFPWRNLKGELVAYFTELTQPPVREFFRANLWPNTPDILTEYLQHGGQPAFRIRLVLAATLGASYGIYGPAFERCENVPREPGSEEYLDSEKYELRSRPAGGTTLGPLIARVNRIRRENPALQSDFTLRFHGTDSDWLLAYSKRDEATGNTVLTVVNLSPHHTHAGWVELDAAALGLGHDEAFQVEDLLTGATYLWHGRRNYVELHPYALPAHVFKVHPKRRDVSRYPDFG